MPGFIRQHLTTLALTLLLFAALSAGAPFERGRRAGAATEGRPYRGFPGFVCGHDPRGADEAQHAHRLNALRRRALARPDAALAPGGPRVTEAEGVAVIEDDGSLILPLSKFDLKNRALRFTPDGDGFRIEKAEVGFEGNYGTRFTYFFDAAGTLRGENNGYREVPLFPAFPFHGAYHERAFVGTNGYVTFGAPDTSGSPSVATFADLPRLAPLWADLDLSDRGAAYYRRLDDRHLFTWSDAPEVLYGGANTFQLALYDDGRIAFVYKKVKARGVLTGVATGQTDPAARPVDLSDPPAEAVAGPFYESFARQKRLDLPAITQAFYRAYPDDFDAVYVWSDFGFDNGPGYARSFNVRNDIRGIGLRQFDRGALFGSAARLATVISMGDVTRGWPADPDANVVGLYSATSIMCHELGHRWLLYVRFDADHDIKDDLLGREQAHWSFLADSRVNAEGSVSSTMEGNAWRENSNGSFTSISARADYFSPLDQYLMGLRAADEVGDIAYLEVAPDLKEVLRFRTPTPNITLSANRKVTSVAQIIEREGVRAPDVNDSPKAFRAAFILLTERGASPSDATLATLRRYREALGRYFAVATGRRAALDTSLAGEGMTVNH